MLDPRPVVYVIGLLVAVLGATMLLPMLVDLSEGRGEWRVFGESALITMLIGTLAAISCQNSVREGLSIRQTFLLTTTVWAILPVFGAIPLMTGATELRFVDAFFESTSGLTTTGATVIEGLDDLPAGILLWRGILQWLGGIGIIVFAMVFLPELRVGGMQIFRSESFDTFGKILPRATAIASQISVIYVAMTMACALAYAMLGMDVFDATVHALTTISTGGFSTRDASFGAFSGNLEYVATLFMILAALPFVRYVQMINGHTSSLWEDVQTRGFLITIGVLVAVTTVVLLQLFPNHWEQSLREAMFNLTSIISGTGYASADYMQWGPFLIAIFFFIGLIGGCAESAACSVKIFRYQLLLAAIRAQVQRIRSPHRVFVIRYDGRRVDQGVLSSVISFFSFFIVTLGLLALGLGLTGLDFTTSVSGAASAIANIGPGLGDTIGPTGNFSSLNDAAKWMLIAGMLIGRLEILTVFALFTIRFWRG
ncbi:MAG: TrkH family potassium uptake protein [Paracoccaceae bacterium]